MAADNPAVPAVAAAGINKSFGGVHALTDAEFSATRAEVHALVGENGAGKSTLIKIMGGRLQPDTGTLRIEGEQVALRRTQDAHARGVWTVFQELMLLPAMTVAENLLLGHEPRGAFGLIRRGQLAAEAEATLANLGINHIDPRALVEDISLAERQIVEIARVVIRGPKVLLLDEPTSALVEREVAWLFGVVRRLRDAGTCVIFTSHRWNEITSIADRITIYRNGRGVGTFTEIDEDEAVTLMAGRRVESLYPALPAAPKAAAVLTAERLTGPGLQEVSLAVAPGEILGVGGLAGHGHRELFQAVFGAVPASTGRIVVMGKPRRIRTPRDAIRAGMALVPEDRKTEGLILPLPVRDNLTLAILQQLSRCGLIRLAEERRRAEEMARGLSVRAAGVSQVVGTLSGGNQQKVLLGRWLLARAKILLLYDVTRGVDVATKHEIYELMMRLAAEGKALLFYSSDADELAHLCHRVLVMREGRIAAELLAPGLTAEDIVAAAMREVGTAAAHPAPAGELTHHDAL
jgi:ribose transport system ATP-binding protein